MIMVPLNRQVGAPKIPGPAGGKKGNLLVLVHMFAWVALRARGACPGAST